MVPDDLSRYSDEDLYELEQHRALDHASWAQIDDELRRRRASRRASALADVAADPATAPAQPTLGDLERVTASLEATFQTRLADLDARVRHLRWWVVATPLLWLAVAAVAAWVGIHQWAPATLRGVSLLP